MNYDIWTPDTGTREMPSFRRGVPLTDQPTEPLWLLDLYPPSPTRYERPTLRGRLRGWFPSSGRPTVAEVGVMVTSAVAIAVLVPAFWWVGL